MTTGEFRTAPDASASTAQFRAFAEGDKEPGRSWEVNAPGRSAARMVALIVGIVVVLAIVVVLVLTLG